MKMRADMDDGGCIGSSAAAVILVFAFVLGLITGFVIWGL